jgi:hypothetical protein
VVECVSLANRGDLVEKRTTNGYIWMGTSVRFLRDVTEGWPVFGEGFVVGNIENLCRYLSQYEMIVTTRVAEPFETFRQKAMAELAEAQGEDPDTGFEDSRTLTRAEAEKISRIANEVQITMLAEAKGQVAFITRDKRFPVDRLLDDVASLMPDGVFHALPDHAKYDFAEAGRCIAFELPTAAGFHLMRGTEAVLRDFYQRIVKRDRVDPLLWGPMTNHLRGRRVVPPDVLMNNLDNIRKSFRNPTQHPEKIYDIDEAQDLMGLAVEVVTRMQRHLVSLGK